MTESDALVSQDAPRTDSLALRPPGAIEVRATRHGTDESQTYLVPLPFAIIGRIPQAGVRLDDPSVSRCHAMLHLVDGVPYCIDLGSRTGVLWDDGGQGRGWVRPGQAIRIGTFDVQILATGVVPPPAPPADETDPAPRVAALDVCSPTGISGLFPLDLPVTLIGRHPNCDLRFLEETVALFQCALVRTQQGIWCVDLLSQKGTALNGRLVRVALLRDGDPIELGKVTLVVRAGPQPPHLPAAVSGPGLRTTNVVESMLHTHNRTSAETNALAFREMMEQFQQCFLTMARMFTTMQQEHMEMMGEQMRQIRELLRETRPPASPAPTGLDPTPAPPARPPEPPPRVPTPKPVDPEEARTLADAHTWFLNRLNQNGSPGANKPEPT